MRNENPAQHPSTLPQRGGGRLVATPFAGPSFLFSFSLPRVASSVLCLLSLSARAVLKSSTFAPHLLHPLPNQKPDENRKPCQPASTAARRWAACSRSLFRPKFLHSAIPLPRVVPPLFPLFRFSLARCRSFFSLMRNVQPLPLSRGYREGAGCARCPVRPGLLH